MSHISNIRLLSSNPLLRLPFSSTSSLFFKPKSPLKPYTFSSFKILSYFDRRDGRKGGGFARQRRDSSTLGGERGKEKGRKDLEMEEKKEGTAGFNKRRAEGRDAGLKRRNLQHKTPKLNPINTICYVQILGTGMDTQDTSPSVLLFFDKQRFIFNAGEGLQRFCTEHKIKLSKIDHMFLTRVCSETAGGLPGLLLTLAGIGEEGVSMNIWGPSDLNYLVDAMKSFIPHATMVHTHCFGETQNKNEHPASFADLSMITDSIILVDDEVVRLSATLLKPTKATGSSINPGDIAVVYACELPEITGKFDPEKAKSLGLKPGPKYRELQLGNSVMSDHLNIMVHPSDVLGPSLAGPIVLIVDCPTPDHMLELFSLQSLKCYYIDFQDHGGGSIKSVNCVIHMGPASVTKNAEYQQWMKKFGSAQHIMAGHEMRNMEIPILKSSARISSSLNYICPQLFPAPGFWKMKLLPQPKEHCEVPSTFSNSVSAENLLKFHLRPYAQLGLDRSSIPSTLDYREIVDKLLSEIPGIADVSEHVSEFWPAHNRSVMPKEVETSTMVEEPWMDEASWSSNGNLVHVNGDEKKGPNQNSDLPSCLENITREDMEIVLLGTGSSQPSKYRNVSSIFVNLFSRGSLLLDCGEGTLAQLKRRFGVEGADNAVKSLRCIWVSHIHADHHTGLSRVLALRSQLLKNVPHEPIIVIGPRQLKRFLDAYSRLEDLDMQFLDCRYTTETSLHPSLSCDDSREVYPPKHAKEKDKSQFLRSTLFEQGSRMESHWRSGNSVDSAVALPILMKLQSVLHEAGLEALYSVPVIHCPQAFGVVLKAAERINSVGETIPGWKLVYSGDTRPCQALIDASSDATVLIHEATFEDGMEEEAIVKNHSTTKEAIEVGTSAAAYRIILTHFSQRYPKVPVFDEAHMDRTCIAFDLMSVNAADLHVLPRVLPYLKVLFKNEMVVDESDDVTDAAAGQLS